MQTKSNTNSSSRGSYAVPVRGSRTVAAEVAHVRKRPRMYLPKEPAVSCSVLQTSIEAVLRQLYPDMMLGTGALRMIAGRVLMRLLATLLKAATKTRTAEGLVGGEE